MDVLIVDDERISRQHLQRQLERWGHPVVVAETGGQAWEILKSQEISLVISDWQMPGMSGLDLVRNIRRELPSRYVYTILLTARSDPEDLIEGMEAGADDFLTKPFNAGELRVRLRAGARVIQLERALAEGNRQMQADLQAAAKFAKSLLPRPMDEPWNVTWKYVPSSVVSGDALGYHWIDHEHFAVYLLDVTGHGLDAALLATTLLNVIRSGSLPHTDFRDPTQVLAALNGTFHMEQYGDKCFTIWYGVISRSTQWLRWSGGGHPPAILLGDGADVPVLLRSSGPLMGGGLDFEYTAKEIAIPSRASLFVYSDGAHELRTAGGVWPHAEFIKCVQDINASKGTVEDLHKRLEQMNGRPEFEDDLTLIHLRFDRQD